MVDNNTRCSSTATIDIVQMTGLVSIPFVGLAVAWTLKPELANRDLKYD